MSSGATLVSPLTGRRMGGELHPHSGVAELLRRVSVEGLSKPFWKTAVRDTNKDKDIEVKSDGMVKLSSVKYLSYFEVIEHSLFLHI